MKIIKNLFTFMSHIMDATSYYTKNCMGIKKRNSQGWTLRNIKNIVLKIKQVFCPVDNTLRALQLIHTVYGRTPFQRHISATESHAETG